MSLTSSNIRNVTILEHAVFLFSFFSLIILKYLIQKVQTWDLTLEISI